MNHVGTQTLFTERLMLRKFTLEDVDQMYDNWASDPDVAKYMTWGAHQNKEETKQILTRWVESYNQDNYYHWGIVLKESNSLIGSISVVKIDENNNTVEVGYCLSKRWWRQKIMSETLKKVIEFLFEQAGVKQIRASHDINNPNSGKVMVKCNMKFEGIYKNAARTNKGTPCDVAYYYILKDNS